METEESKETESYEQEELNDDFMSRSILLNMDFFEEEEESHSQEETKETKETKETGQASKSAQAKQNTATENVKEEIDRAFVLDIEDKGKKSEIYKVRKEVEAYTRGFRKDVKKKESIKESRQLFHMGLSFTKDHEKEFDVRIRPVNQNDDKPLNRQREKEKAVNTVKRNDSSQRIQKEEKTRSYKRHQSEFDKESHSYRTRKSCESDGFQITGGVADKKRVDIKGEKMIELINCPTVTSLAFQSGKMNLSLSEHKTNGRWKL